MIFARSAVFSALVASASGAALRSPRQLTSCPADAAVTSCYMRDLDSGAEQEITGDFTHNQVVGGRYSIRCDVEGALEHSKWHFGGEVSDDWEQPFWMKNNDDDGVRVWDVDYLTTCGEKSFTVEVFVWGVDEPCASKTVSFNAPCLEVESCARRSYVLHYSPSVPTGTKIELRDPATDDLAATLTVTAAEGATTKRLTNSQRLVFKSMKPRKPEMRFVTELGAGPWVQCSENTPIGLDIDGSGSVERIKGDFFLDISGDGDIEHLHEWFAPSEGILIDAALATKDGVISAQHFAVSADSRELKHYSGSITGKHLFGDMGSLFADGFKKLEGHDGNHDGHVKGSELAGLAIWVDSNSNAKVDAGELSDLSTYGIVGLDTTHDNYVSSAKLMDGSIMVTEDLWFSR